MFSECWEFRNKQNHRHHVDMRGMVNDGKQMLCRSSALFFGVEFRGIANRPTGSLSVHVMYAIGLLLGG